MGGIIKVKHIIPILVILLLLSSGFVGVSNTADEVTVLEDPPGIVWSKTYGGVDGDYAMSVQQTKDGGYIVGGYTASYGAGDLDAWLIKTDSEGNELWSKTYGGEFADGALCVIETNDGGYAIAGYAEYSQGNFELWIIKTYENGTEVWSKRYRKGNRVFGNCIIETEYGYVVVAKASGDVWLVGTDENGEMVWNNTFGGAGGDTGDAVIQDDYGDYVIVGTTYSFGEGDPDIWLIKTNETGEELWNKTFGGAGHDTGGDIIQTYDGGFAITGSLTPYTGGWRDVCLIKTDKYGNETWTNLYGGDDLDYGKSLIQTIDGDYLIAGITHSYGPKGFNAWMIKADENGSELWNVSLGGWSDDHGNSVTQSNDGGFIIAGKYRRFGSFDDAWLIKIGHRPIVTIDKPINGLYFMDFLIRPYLFRSPLIIGSINVEVDASDSKYDIDRVEFYIDDEFQANDSTDPYSWKWNMMSFSRHTLKVTAFNTNETSASDEMTVWKFL